MPFKQRIARVRLRVGAGVSLLDDLQKRTTHPSYHAALEAVRKQYVSLQNTPLSHFERLRWLDSAEHAVALSDRDLDRLADQWRMFERAE